jgi:hypothetical protein
MMANAGPSEHGRLTLTVLIGSAIFMSLAPIPVVALELLPAYHLHSRFLIFYTPVVCLVVMGYILYVRDAIAQVLFAELLDPWDPADGYYVESHSERARRIWRRLRATLMALLPVVLLIGSFVCIIRYVTRFDESVAIASQMMVDRIPHPQMADSAVGDSMTPAPDVPDKLAALRRLPGLAADPDPLRTFTLQVAKVDEIPFFTELTALFIGAFACAMAALFLVLVKEYAKEVLELSESDVLAGRILNGDTETSLEPAPMNALEAAEPPLPQKAPATHVEGRRTFTFLDAGQE